MLSINRQALGGSLILAMITVTIANGLIPVDTLPFNLLWLSGVCGWLAAALLIDNTSRALQIQVGLLIVIGLALFAIAFEQNAHVAPHIDQAINGNSGLLTMVASVGFLRLVAIPRAGSNETLPVGKRAYLYTLLGINLSSSVINISAPVVVSDRIHHQRPIQRFTSQSFTRVFCGVASWSPFFGSMAVVLTFVEGVQLQNIMLIGLPFTIVGFAIVYAEARWRYKSEIDNFVGYPMHLSGLTVPLLLIFAVVLWSWLLPETAVLIVIALCALVVSAVMLVFREGLYPALRQLGQYVTVALPRSINELVLFLAAGVLASGMSMMIENGFVENPFNVFDAFTAAQLLLIIVFFAMLGIHPVIMISSFTPLLMPLDPNPTLLTITYLIAWNLGTCASPLSGTHLVFQGRYGIPSWKAAIWNWPYAIVMCFIAALWLQVIHRYLI